MTESSQSPESGWELAQSEELLGDALFFAGDPGATPHYVAAQRAPFPQGSIFTSAAENDRRMEAYRRLTDKLYAVGPDGRSRPGHWASPHPRFRRPPARLADTALGRLYRDSSHWKHHRLGELWEESAVALAADHPRAARRACRWSLHFYELYNRAWNAHLPASRWDSDGGEEIVQVQRLEEELAAKGAGAPAPEWVDVLLGGDWMTAAALSATTPEPPVQPLRTLLEDATQNCRLSEGGSGNSRDT